MYFEENKRRTQKALKVSKLENLYEVSGQTRSPGEELIQEMKLEESSEQPSSVFKSEFELTSEIGSELQEAIAQITPYEREHLAQKFYQRLRSKGLEVETLNLSTQDPRQMTVQDISKLAYFAYQKQPNIFQEVMAEQSGIICFLSNSIVAAILGMMAAKWLTSDYK